MHEHERAGFVMEDGLSHPRSTFEAAVINGKSPHASVTARMKALVPTLVLVASLGLIGVACADRDEAAAAHADRPSETGPVQLGTKALVITLGGVAALFGALLYVMPARAAEATRKKIERSMTERAITQAEEDRRRIARELHDGAGQALTAARLQLAALRQNVVGHRDEIEQILACVDEAMNEVRHSTSALAPPALAEFGLRGAIQRHCQSFSAASHLPVRFDAPLPLPPLAAITESTCYRIVQEALHNAARHAGGKQAWVRIEIWGDHLRLEVGDDGPGLPDEAKGGFGLESIRDRAKLAGGSAKLVERRGPGPRIVVTLPLGGVES
jgi:signal transduction histidine kinase